MSDFKLYQKCLIPNLAPHEVPDTSNISKEIVESRAYFARWTSGFDNTIASNDDNNWYYVIKDNKWSINDLTSHDRNEVNKGIRNFECKIIEPSEYLQEMYSIYYNAISEYPKMYKNIKTLEDFKKINEKAIFFGAFDREDEKLSAYAECSYYDSKDGSKVVNFGVLKIEPSKLKKSPSAALVSFICDYFLNQQNVKYICDGERAIRHITNFQKYLEKYFGFRKAYCKLNIVYSNYTKIVVKFLFPFRLLIGKLSHTNKWVYNVYALLKQEEIRRNC